MKISFNVWNGVIYHTNVCTRAFNSELLITHFVYFTVKKKRSPFAQWKKKKSYANVYVTEKSVGFGRSAETEYADALKESEWRKQFKWVQI